MSDRRWRAALLLAAMCAVVAVSTAAASPAHHHTEAADCVLCCVGHLPALQSPYLSDLRPAVVSVWQVLAEEYHSNLDPQYTAALGRAPPR